MSSTSMFKIIMFKTKHDSITVYAIPGTVMVIDQRSFVNLDSCAENTQRLIQKLQINATFIVYLKKVK